MYRGRFAPSPTGPLHFGSLVTAVASYCDALRHQGEWLVRMEDVDRPRCVDGASQDILQTLRRFGFEWRDPVMHQSDRTSAYEDALRQLIAQGRVYACSCSRRELGGPIYPGTCRNRQLPLRPDNALRLRVDDVDIGFEDRRSGRYEQNLARVVGDFVIRRADGLFAYQMAVVVDDAAQEITDIVRGLDLLDSTPRQIFLQRLLGYSTPRYLHVPLVTNDAGEKLSKRTLAPPLDFANKTELLANALSFLKNSGILLECTNWLSPSLSPR